MLPILLLVVGVVLVVGGTAWLSPPAAVIVAGAFVFAAGVDLGWRR